MTNSEVLRYPGWESEQYAGRSRLADDERLKENPLVKFSENQHSSGWFPARLVETFADVADNLRVLDGDKSFPHVVVRPDYLINTTSRGRLPFMVAWSESGATEPPLPHAWKTASYFSGLERAIADRHCTALVSDTLDGYGALGYVALLDDEPVVRLVMRAQDGDGYVRTQHTVPAGRFSSLGVDLLVDLKAYKPLRFHAGIRYWGSNGCLAQVDYPDDELRLLGTFGEQNF